MKIKYNNPNDLWYYGRRYNLKSQDSMKGCFYSTIAVVILVVITLLLSSCRSIKYVPVETVKTEYITKTDTFIQKDSIHTKDSIFVFKKGDTVFMNKFQIIYKDRWRETIKTDTVIKVDSIQVPYPVEKPLSKWQQLKMDLGAILVILCFIAFLVIVGYFLLFRRKR